MGSFAPLLLVLGLVAVLYLLTRGKKPLVRDVSRLERGKGSLDVVHEQVQPEGAPLREHHRRKVLYDPRLLPKAGKRERRRDRERLFDARSARRRFSLTMRSKDRRLSLLVADEEQLRRYGLPLFRDEADLAEALGIGVGQLRHLSMHRVAERTPHYVTFAIRKRSGGARLIHAPKRRLKAVQRKLLELLVDKLPVHDAAHGFRHDRSIRTCAEPHVGKRVVLKLDVREFFPSITFARVRGYLVAMGYGYEVATTIACLCTEAERQPVEIFVGALVHVPVGPRRAPQGAPTSPGLSNAICLRLDRRLEGLARAHGFAYTRYADDLTFSGDRPDFVGKLRARAIAVLREEGFEPNEAKTRVMRSGGAQRVTGVTVNAVLGLSRKERRKLRAEIHHATTRGAEPARIAQLEGRIAYVHMLNPAQADALRRKAAAWRAARGS